MTIQGLGLAGRVTTDQSLDAPTAVPRSTPKKASGRLTATLPVAGGVVDEYEIASELARGAMGVVYRARDTQLGRAVALKMILDTTGPDDPNLKRFENEARSAASLDHPGIVAVYGVGRYQGFPYFTMALVEGSSLAAQLAAGPLLPRRCAEIAEQVARAAAHAHEHRLIHRDLKPANIMIDESGMARVTDFGVSKSLESSCELTTSGEVVGTPHYMPPEQASGRGGPIGPAADIYAIGAILYAMLTGRPPFQAATPIEVISQVLTQDAVSPRRLNTSVPSELEVITLKCLSKSPGDRYATAEALGDDLARFLRGEPIAARPPGWFRQARFLLRRHVLWASVSGTAALILVCLTMVVMVALVRAQNRIQELEDEMQRKPRSVASRTADDQPSRERFGLPLKRNSSKP